MDRNYSHMTGRILDLTLQIIYLLIGESYPPVKYNDHVTITVPQPPFLTTEMNTKKILEVTQKIIEQLTGEVPLRSQDVTVYFSMDEWEYLEGHKTLYKDIMVDDQPPLVSPDESSNRNPPDSPSHLYSQDSTPKDHTMTHHYEHGVLTDIKVEDKNREEEAYLMSGWTHKGNDVPAEFRTGVTVIGEIADDLLDLFPKYNIKDESASQDSPAENLLTPDINLGHSYMPPNLVKNELWESEIATHQTSHSVEMSYACAECGKCFTGKRNLHRHYKSHSEMKPHSCSECGKGYTWKSELIQHQRVHTGEKPFSCLECGKSFSWKTVLLKHQRVHTGGKLPCPDCGECFTWKSDLDKHKRKAHTGERTLSCTDCGKRYTSRSHLLDHQRTHTGEKPFSCTQCERCFTSMAQLNKHRRTHTSDQTFSCSE